MLIGALIIANIGGAFRETSESDLFLRSSLSVGLNSTSVVILEDFVKGCFKMKPSERCSSIFVKLLVVLLGLFALSLVFLVEKVGGVLSVSV